jgi:hypothetical protein
MKRSAQRRSNARVRNLKEKGKNHAAFQQFINPRLESWLKEMSKRANTGDSGSAHDLADKIKSEMQGVIASARNDAYNAEQLSSQLQAVLTRTRLKIESLRSAAVDPNHSNNTLRTSLTEDQLTRLRMLKEEDLREIAPEALQIKATAGRVTQTAAEVVAVVSHIAAAEIAKVAKSHTCIPREDKQPYVKSRAFLIDANGSEKSG